MSHIARVCNKVFNGGAVDNMTSDDAVFPDRDVVEDLSAIKNLRLTADSRTSSNPAVVIDHNGILDACASGDDRKGSNLYPVTDVSRVRGR
jgi:hypothetical protein